MRYRDKEKKPQPKCDICGEDSPKLFCNICIRRHSIELILLEDGKMKSLFKNCSLCQFYSSSKCEITKEEVEKNYYCLYFTRRRNNAIY